MMTIQQPLLSLLLIALAIGIALYARRRWRLRHVRPTAATGSLLLWCGAFWILTNALEMAGTDLSTAWFWHRVQYAAIVPVPPLWLYMALQFTGYQQLMTRRLRLLISLVPVVGLTMALTNDFHQLFVTNVRFDSVNSFADINYDPGLFLVIIYLYGYILILLGTYLLTRRLLRSEGFRWQGSIVLLGVVLAVGANILDWSRLNPFPYIKLTPLALALAIPLFIVTLMRARRADLVPIARGNVIQGMEDAVLVLDVENHLIDLNPAAEAIVGHLLAQVLGKFIHEAWPQGAPHFEALAANRSSEIRHGEGREQRIYDARPSELRDRRGQLIARVIVLRDITERVTTDEALRASEERYRLHFANVSDVVYSFDDQFRLLSITPSIERHLGLKPEDVVGRSMLELSILPPEYLERAAAEALRVLNGERIDGAIYEFVAVDGTRKTAEISSSPVFQDGRVVSAINVARNISERVQAEERLHASLAEKEVLLKEVHHRVKNNMQIIASLLNLQLAAIRDPAARAQFQDSQNRIRSMALVHERLYRSDDFASLDFGDYLADLTAHLLQSYRTCGRNVNLILDAAGIDLDMDTAIPCGLIVSELVSNALKHAFPGDRQGTIRVEVRRNDQGLTCLSVRDDGIGMPAGIDLTRTTTLGLQLVASLAHQLQGMITLQSESGAAVSIAFDAQRGRTGARQNREREAVR